LADGIDHARDGFFVVGVIDFAGEADDGG